jgi:hypothetical protein
MLWENHNANVSGIDAPIRGENTEQQRTGRGRLIARLNPNCYCAIAVTAA